MTTEKETNKKTISISLPQIEGVMEGDFFILSSEKGYTPSQRKEAMQVMECWDKVMTVKCKGGCMTKEYDHFEKVTDLSGFRSVHRYDGEMEDRRSYHPA